MSRIGEALARHLSCLGSLPDADRAALSALDGEQRTVRRYEDILRAGEQPNTIVVVLSGFLHRYTVGPEGARQLHSFYLPSEAPSLETLYIDYMDNNLAACTDSEIGLIPHDQMYRIIEERPEARKLIWRQTLVQGAIFRQWLARNSNMPSHASLAHLFCELLTRARSAGLVENGTCDLPITQELVADALGMTAVHTNRTLKLLRDSGVIEWRNGKLTVHDWDRLAEIADFDASYLHLSC